MILKSGFNAYVHELIPNFINFFDKHIVLIEIFCIEQKISHLRQLL